MAQNPTREDREHQRVMRDLRQQGQAAVTWGLPNPATETAILGMGLVMRDRLADQSGEDRAAAAAALAEAMLERTLQKMPQAAAVQCSRGCFYCCHSVVTVSAPEVFRIVRQLTADTPRPAALERSAVIERAKARSRPTMQAVLSVRHPCPLLIDNACSVHDVRPMGCRQFLSTDVAGCRSAFEKDIGQMPYIPAAANAGLIVRSLLMGAGASLGLKPELFELSSALAAGLAEPDAERRWLAGEDVLAAALKMPMPPNMQSGVQRWAEMLAGLFV